MCVGAIDVMVVVLTSTLSPPPSSPPLPSLPSPLPALPQGFGNVVCVCNDRQEGEANPTCSTSGRCSGNFCQASNDPITGLHLTCHTNLDPITFCNNTGFEVLILCCSSDLCNQNLVPLLPTFAPTTANSTDAVTTFTTTDSEGKQQRDVCLMCCGDPLPCVGRRDGLTF